MSYKLYPVTPTELNFDGYEVKINGEKAVTNTNFYVNGAPLKTAFYEVETNDYCSNITIK